MIEGARRIQVSSARTKRADGIRLGALLALILMGGCETTEVLESSASSHNASGGYAEACGELPGLLGDDC